VRVTLAPTHLSRFPGNHAEASQSSASFLLRCSARKPCLFAADGPGTDNVNGDSLDAPTDIAPIHEKKGSSDKEGGPS
jgi:hypothetical protein